MRTIRRNIARNAKKYAAKATVSAMMLAGGVMMASPILSSTVSAATEHWNDASASNIRMHRNILQNHLKIILSYM